MKPDEPKLFSATNNIGMKRLLKLTGVNSATKERIFTVITNHYPSIDFQYEESNLTDLTPLTLATPEDVVISREFADELLQRLFGAYRSLQYASHPFVAGRTKDTHDKLLAQLSQEVETERCCDSGNFGSTHTCQQEVKEETGTKDRCSLLPCGCLWNHIKHSVTKMILTCPIHCSDDPNTGITPTPSTTASENTKFGATLNEQVAVKGAATNASTSTVEITLTEEEARMIKKCFPPSPKLGGSLVNNVMRRIASLIPDEPMPEPKGFETLVYAQEKGFYTVKKWQKSIVDLKWHTGDNDSCDWSELVNPKAVE